MQDILSLSIKKLRRDKARKKRLVSLLLVLSLLVSLDVFWIMRQPGWTLAGDADCRITEHSHDETCYSEESPCQIPEHTHTIECYSDDTADVETQLDWQKMFSSYPFSGDLQKDLVGIAKSQVGYTESLANFQVDDAGLRRGYNRYGAWYGSPYSDWSSLFVSFCLHYAGADADSYPVNTGANSMARLWDKLGIYTEDTGYIPTPGDLVFFRNNTVGIVSEVQTATIYVIRGDVDNTVSGGTVLLRDASIAGWGLTGQTLPEETTPQETLPEETIPQETLPEETVPETQPEIQPETKPDSQPEETKPEQPEETTPEQPEETTPETETEVDLLDISHGPAFFIFEGGTQISRMQTFALRNSQQPTDLLTYLNGKNGSYFFTLLDKNNHELPKDDDGNYIAVAEVGYKLTLSFHSPEGFVPGTYQYQVPNGLQVDGGEGNFVLSDGTNVGSWKVTDEGLITLVFNDKINSRTDITISSTLGIHFPAQNDPLDFDGKISVTVQKPPDEFYPTELEKWGIQGNPNDNDQTNDDESKIYWRIKIIGNKDSHIAGNLLTDQLLLGDGYNDHKFTASDIAAGITIGVSESDPVTGVETQWHQWLVTADDPNLVWNEDGWSYRMPETITCQFCGEIHPGNDGWTYYISYSSTPEADNIAGQRYYHNLAIIDGQKVTGQSYFSQSTIAGIQKDGAFIADASGGKFLWELHATLPGAKPGERYKSWFINDIMSVIDDNGNWVDYIENNMDLSVVTVNYQGQTIVVPPLRYATEDDPFAWMVGHRQDLNGDGKDDLQQISIVSRCTCTPETCGLGTCWTHWVQLDDGTWILSDYCPCFISSEDITFTFVYETNDLSLIQEYGGMGYSLRNESLLLFNENNQTFEASSDHALITVPSVFSKELTHDFNGYTANYKVTVNEAKLVLTDGSPLTIHDTMTDTLAFIKGSLVITAEDADGNITTLKEGTDYTVNYDGSGRHTDAGGNPVHILDIVILNPQPVMYLLDYDATLIIPDNADAGVKYKNSASITLWGQQITDTSTEKIYAEINIAAKNYSVDMFKTSSATGLPLPGATFGLFNEEGGLITTSTTDAEGRLSFETNVVEGIILREHILYYIQELNAPPGYRLDKTKHWFCFCDLKGDSCETCDQLRDQTDVLRIPFEEIGIVNLSNDLLECVLPGTGGPGVYPLILASVIFIIIPLVYCFIQGRKRERRGVG